MFIMFIAIGCKSIVFQLTIWRAINCRNLEYILEEQRWRQYDLLSKEKELRKFLLLPIRNNKRSNHNATDLKKLCKTPTFLKSSYRNKEKKALWLSQCEQLKLSQFNVHPTILFIYIFAKFHSDNISFKSVQFFFHPTSHFFSTF